MYTPASCVWMRGLSEKLSEYGVAVVTGGSSGIGREFIRLLHELRPGLRIFNLSRTISEDNSEGIDVSHKKCDLSSRTERETALSWLVEELALSQPGKLLVVNNSGFGSYGRFPCEDLARQLGIVEVCAAAPLAVAGALLPTLKERGGGIINVSSLSAFQPTPYMATYGAAKAFLLNWSLALGQELRGTGLSVCAICPGPTSSMFYKSAGFAVPPVGSRLAGGSASSADVVRDALHGYCRGKSIVVTGWRNKLAASIAALMPRRAQAVLSEYLLRKLRLETYLERNQ